MDPIKLQDIPEEDVYDYYICYICDRIIKKEECINFRGGLYVSVDGDEFLIQQCKYCYERIDMENNKKMNQERLKRMENYLNGKYEYVWSVDSSKWEIKTKNKQST